MTATQFRAFSVKNLADQVIDRSFDEPWRNAPAIPQFDTREQYKSWMSSPESLVPLFSLVEGQSPSLRVSAANPAYRVHGIVCDYDSPLTDAEVEAGLERVPKQHPLFAWNRTRRGGIRLVFRFETPIWFYGIDVFKRLMGRAKKELRLTSLFPGLDEEVLYKPDQTYAAGDKWTVHESAVVKTQTLYLWLYEVLMKTDEFDGAGVEIPLQIVEAEVHRKFPGRWKGEFKEGSRGIRFWAPEADNETAVIVRKEGCTCFTGDRPFVSWKEIFGREFVSAYLEDTQGKALAQLWCDSQKRYYRQLPDESWDHMNTEQVKRHLKVQFGLSDSVEKGEDCSEVDRLIHRLEISKRIEGGIPFPHNKETIVEFNGSKFLNTATCRLIMPALDPQEWGAEFPWIASYVDRLMKDQKNKDVLLATTAQWLRSCYAGYPTQGHVNFLVGPTGTGKTLWSRCILGRIAGGYADVSKFFTGRSKYIDSAFSKAVWVIDDAIPLSDRSGHQAYSGNVKACAANPTFNYAKKYGYEGEAPFSGRLWVTANNDSTSLEMLPDTDLSILDKVNFLKTGKHKVEIAADPQERYAIIDRELPAFIRWLIDMPLPEGLVLDERFGFVAWQDPELLDEARSATPSNAVQEAIDLWRKDYTPEDGKKKDAIWSGTAAKLMASLVTHSEVGKITVGRMSVIGFAMHLANLVRTGTEWIDLAPRDRNAGKIYLIKML